MCLFPTAAKCHRQGRRDWEALIEELELYLRWPPRLKIFVSSWTTTVPSFMLVSQCAWFHLKSDIICSSISSPLKDKFWIVEKRSPKWPFVTTEAWPPQLVSISTTNMQMLWNSICVTKHFSKINLSCSRNVSSICDLYYSFVNGAILGCFCTNEVNSLDTHFLCKRNMRDVHIMS